MGITYQATFCFSYRNITIDGVSEEAQEMMKTWLNDRKGSNFIWIDAPNHGKKTAISKDGLLSLIFEEEKGTKGRA